jgi:hypothetical protein
VLTSRRRCSRVPTTFSPDSSVLIAANHIVVIITIRFVWEYRWWPTGNVRLNRDRLVPLR